MVKYTFYELPETIRKGILQMANDLTGFEITPDLKAHFKKIKERAEKSTYIYIHDFPVDLLRFVSATPMDFLAKGDLIGYNTIVHFVEELRKGKTIQPIVVRKYKDGYGLIDGYHRADAALYLGIKTLPVLIQEYGDVK